MPKSNKELSIVEISFKMFEKFNPSEEEIKQLISKLNSMLSNNLIEKPKKMTEDELYAQEIEAKLKSKLYPPKYKNLAS